MSDALQIPDTLQMTFKRVLHRLPAEKRNDIEIQKSILTFLKLGGERLAKARIKLVVSPFPESFSVVKLRPQPIIDESIKEDDEELITVDGNNTNDSGES
jgi:hypothetical protein